MVIFHRYVSLPEGIKDASPFSQRESYGTRITKRSPRSPWMLCEKNPRDGAKGPT